MSEIDSMAHRTDSEELKASNVNTVDALESNKTIPTLIQSLEIEILSINSTKNFFVYRKLYLSTMKTMSNSQSDNKKMRYQINSLL